MARTKNYEDNLGKILKVDTKSIEPIVCDGFIFPMHSKYVFELKKVYTEEPARQINGQINYFPPKFFVPYFTIGWDILSVDRFTNIMNYIARDELIVEYYDTFSGTYKKDKFYAQQPTYSGIICQKGEYEYIQGLEIVFAGTLGSRESLTVQFDANGGNLIGGLESPNITGINGEEWVVPNGENYYTYENKTFVGWATEKTSTTAQYFAGQVLTLKTSLVLYAVWADATEYQVSLSYGVGGKYTLNGTDYYDVKDYSSVKVPVSTMKLPSLPINVKVYKSDGTELVGIKDGEETPVYIFNGWNMLASGKGTYVTTGSEWTVSGNGSLYAIMTPKTYTIKINSNGGSAIDDVDVTYGTSVSIPKPTRDKYDFAGYYTDAQLTKQFSVSEWNNKPQDITLYAKWTQ